MAMEFWTSHPREGMSSSAEFGKATRLVGFNGISFWSRTRFSPSLPRTRDRCCQPVSMGQQVCESQGLYYKGHTLDSLQLDTRQKSSDRSQNTCTQPNTRALGTTRMAFLRAESTLLVLKPLSSLWTPGACSQSLLRMPGCMPNGPYFFLGCLDTNLNDALDPIGHPSHRTNVPALGENIPQ